MMSGFEILSNITKEKKKLGFRIILMFTAIYGLAVNDEAINF